MAHSSLLLDWLIMTFTFCIQNLHLKFCNILFSKKFQIENQNLPIDLDPILNNLYNLKETENRFLIFLIENTLK